MPNPLDTIWDSFKTTLDSFDVVRNSLQLATVPHAAFQSNRFASATDQEVLDLLDAATVDIEAQVVMFLYAKFEAVLRDHISAQAGFLAAAGRSNPTIRSQFGDVVC